MAIDQYSVLGKAPTAAELKQLASKDTHLTIEGLNAGYGKMEILHDVNLYASKGQSVCLIGGRACRSGFINAQWFSSSA